MKIATYLSTLAHPSLCTSLEDRHDTIWLLFWARLVVSSVFSRTTQGPIHGHVSFLQTPIFVKGDRTIPTAPLQGTFDGLLRLCTASDAAWALVFKILSCNFLNRMGIFQIKESFRLLLVIVLSFHSVFFSQCFCRTMIFGRCIEVFWTGVKIEPGFIFQCWILNPGYFFFVDNWDLEALKIYPGLFFNSFAYTFFLNSWWSQHVEYWPWWIWTPDYRVLKSCYSQCYQQIFRGRS
jgi:hypothetical protein